MIKTQTPVMTQNQTHLRMVDNRLAGLRTNNKGHPEIQRIEAAREDVLSRMSGEELAGYTAMFSRVLTPQEKKAQDEAERIAMEANRDKPSI